MTTLHSKKSISRSPLRPGFLLITIACFVLSPAAQAVTPAPDGGYPNDNTAEGTDALLHLAGGFFNTAIGSPALRNDTSGGANTAVGAFALEGNNGDNNTATGFEALVSNQNGSGNTATGWGA